MVLRGTDVAFFENFKNDYPAASVINLNKNYRSKFNTIVNASSQLINAEPAIAKARKKSEKIMIDTANSEEAEAEFVVRTIEALTRRPQLLLN